MRAIIKASGLVAPLILRNKIAVLDIVLSQLMDSHFLRDLNIDWIVMRGIPRSILGGRTDLAFMTREELIKRDALQNMSVKEVVKSVEKNISSKWEKYRVLIRDLEIVFGIRAYFYDYPVAGTIYLRGSGASKRRYGDLEIVTYNLKYKLDDMASLYSFVAKEHEGKRIAKDFARIAEAILIRSKELKFASVKGLFIQYLNSNINIDYDETVAVAHNDPRAHFAYVVRFMRKKRKEIIEKGGSLVSETEIKVYKRLSSFLNYSTIYNKVANRDEFIRATIKAYRNAGFHSSRGSLIISSRTDESLVAAYMSYLEYVLDPFMSAFPEKQKFEEWIEEGLKSVKKKAGFI